mgnify:CR=1 FL=1|jgi:hypothetical protein
MEQMLELNQSIDFLHKGRKIDQGIIKGRAFNRPDLATYNIEFMDGETKSDVSAKDVRIAS